MRKNIFLVGLLLLTLAIPAGIAQAAPPPPVDWAWLLDQVASGAETIVLPNSIAREGDEGIVAIGDTLRIDGKGYTLTGALVDGGTVVFKDVKLMGTHGFGEENGGDALTLRGEGTIAVLLGTTRAEGGRSAQMGESGGDGVQLTAASQGLIMNENATAAGGIGRLYGGTGVRVDGCGSSVLITDSATMIGGVGLATGGAGLSITACCQAALTEQSSATGGASVYTGGSGIDSVPCGACDTRAAISLANMAMAIGGVGQDGGHGIQVVRDGAREGGDLLLSDTCMVLGGDGNVAGSALRATGASIVYAGTPMLIGGMYYETEAPAVETIDCEISGDAEAAIVTEGGKTENYPARNVSSIINNALTQQSDRYTPTVLEEGLFNSEALVTKLDGLTVERGGTSQAKVGSSGLKIFMYNGTLEKRLKFQQRLMSDGDQGARLVLIGQVSDEWPTIESTIPALQKLLDLGVTQLAYTCVSPVYNERVLDIATLVAAVDAYDGEVDKVMCGTADDAIIFIDAKGTRDYQEPLMGEVIRPAF